MWLAVLLTVLASTGNNVGRALQKKGTRGLPRLMLDRKIVLQYLLNKTWSSGLAIDVAGALLMVVAVSMAPVSVVQPVAGAGLAVLAVFSHFYLGGRLFPRALLTQRILQAPTPPPGERLQTGEWVAVGLSVLGTVGVGATAPPAAPIEDTSVRRIMGGLALFGGVLGVGTFWLNKKSASAKVDHAFAGSKMESLMVGMQAGACFGLSAVACRTGFLLAESGGPNLFIPAGLVASIGLTTSGFFCQTKGLKDGNAVVVSTCAAVASIVVGALVGIVALGEHMPHGLGAVLSWGCIIAGIGVLAGGAAGGTSGGAARALLKQVVLPEWIVGRLPQRLQKGYRATGHKKPYAGVEIASKV